MGFQSEQEQFWAGCFGDEYCDRVSGDKFLAFSTYLFSNIIRPTCDINSVLEFGANIGLNLRALQSLMPSLELSAIEINPKASALLKKIRNIKHVYEQSILDYRPDYQRDLVLIKTVLIHINPDYLQKVYELLYKASCKYICIVEYYSPTPLTVEYRGHSEKLFKRDFAGEILDKYEDLKLIDYGFFYHRDNNFPVDDINWFLLKKNN
jgi:pseudaminic acid biosynthesis-associated methylase